MLTLCRTKTGLRVSTKNSHQVKLVSHTIVCMCFTVHVLAIICNSSILESYSCIAMHLFSVAIVFYI